MTINGIFTYLVGKPFILYLKNVVQMMQDIILLMPKSISININEGSE